jgi:MSHA biogenesis protein MshJ
MMQVFRQQFDALASGFNERPIRERALLTITAFVAVLFIGWKLAIAPIIASNNQLEARQASLSDIRASLLEQKAGLEEQLASDPSQVLRNQLGDRQQRLDKLNSELAETTGRLIAPPAMVVLLRDMLAAQDQLELLAVNLLAPVSVFDGQPNSAGDDQNEMIEPLLFAHDVEIVLRGGYMDVLGYLETLEAMDARLGWLLLEFDSNNYPNSEVRIRVRTLSMDRAWLGV